MSGQTSFTISAMPRKNLSLVNFRRLQCGITLYELDSITSACCPHGIDRTAARRSFGFAEDEMVFLAFGTLRFWEEARLLSRDSVWQMCRKSFCFARPLYRAGLELEAASSEMAVAPVAEVRWG